MNKPFKVLKKLTERGQKLFSFFSSKFAVMLIRSTSIACNVPQPCDSWLFSSQFCKGAVIGWAVNEVET